MATSSHSCWTEDFLNKKLVLSWGALNLKYVLFSLGFHTNSGAVWLLIGSVGGLLCWEVTACWIPSRLTDGTTVSGAWGHLLTVLFIRSCSAGAFPNGLTDGAAVSGVGRCFVVVIIGLHGIWAVVVGGWVRLRQRLC